VSRSSDREPPQRALAQITISEHTPTHIQLSSLLGPEFDAQQYKLHAARRSREGVDPLSVFAADRDAWVDWNRWRGTKNDFNRPLVFSIMQLEPGSHRWIFGGAFAVTERLDVQRGLGYEVLPVGGLLDSFIGRLNIKWRPPTRGRSFLMEKFIDQMTVLELTPQAWTGPGFPGMDQINHSFRDLELVVRTNRPDWRSVLEQMKGVYVWNDMSSGLAYIGSATSETGGLWSRIGAYISTGDGGNDGLRELVRRRGLEHIRSNFRLALLEYWPMRKDDTEVLIRESYWKDVFQTRDRQRGYNRN
jgi:hypothetical protein